VLELGDGRLRQGHGLGQLADEAELEVGLHALALQRAELTAQALAQVRSEADHGEVFVERRELEGADERLEGDVDSLIDGAAASPSHEQALVDLVGEGGCDRLAVAGGRAKTLDGLDPHAYPLELPG